MPVMTRLGLTGGIGSGKSTVAHMLSDHGATVIDADAIARSVTAPGGAAINQIALDFGVHMISPEGGLDRDRMRTLAYADPAARKRLEAIVHPLVGQETERQTLLAAQENRPCVVFDVPLLVESGERWRKRVHRVLVVDCSVATQLERVMARNGLAREEIERIVAAQASRTERLAAADIVIHNEALSLDGLREEVSQIAKRFGL
jgi:dephospho-CoA kinase